MNDQRVIPSKNIILYGMRGVGKSTLGRLTAERLRVPFVDLDAYIQEKIGQPISQYIEQEGRDIFRTMEHLCCREVLQAPGTKVVSLGGGTIIFPRNQTLILENNHLLVHITAPLDTIIQRITQDESNGNTRNTLTDTDTIQEITQVYTERKPIYESYADITIHNTGPLKEIIDSIVEKTHIGGICIPITNFSENTYKQICKNISLEKKVKYIELRIDSLDDMNVLPDIIAQAPRQTIVTNRHTNEGGKYSGNIGSSLHRLHLASIAGATYCDIEIALLQNSHKQMLQHITHHSGLILSYHNFEHVESIEKLKQVVSRMIEYNADVIKLACMTTSDEEIQLLEELVERIQQTYPGQEHIIIGMGEVGKKTRVEFPRRGGLLTFSTWGTMSSAPGQLSVDEMYTALYT